jgi:hypothetical protein
MIPNPPPAKNGATTGLTTNAQRRVEVTKKNTKEFLVSLREILRVFVSSRSIFLPEARRRWQLDRELRAAAHFGLGVNSAAVRLDDFARRGQS